MTPSITSDQEALLGFTNNENGESFADEVDIFSTTLYPPEYAGPAPIEKQIIKLATLFNLSLGATMQFVDRLPTLALPEGAEGWFAIPSVDALAVRYFPHIDDPATRYCYAVELVLARLNESRDFFNRQSDAMGPDRLCQHTHTTKMLEEITAEQKGDILVIPAQFGMWQRGRSARRARSTFYEGEFGLGALAVGAMTLTHPTRFMRWEQLHTYAAGDGFAVNGEFTFTPLFSFYQQLRFDAHPISLFRGIFGAATGFLPEKS